MGHVAAPAPAGIEGTLSYVHRNGRDQWTKAGNDTDGYRYTNDGRSTTDGVSLTLRPLEPWRLGETRWNLLATGAGRSARPTATGEGL